jgi:DNA-binding NtrC family response regulator
MYLSAHPAGEQRRLTLLSCAADKLCQEFAAAAGVCGFSSRILRLSDRGGDAFREDGLVAVWSGAGSPDGPDEWLHRLPDGQPCFGVFDVAPAGAAQRLAAACSDFVVWPARLEEVALRLERFSGAALPQPARGDPDLAAEFASLNMVGRSEAFLRVLERVKRIALTEAAVLIEGPTGTGKDLVARAIHYLGPRRGRAFVAVNCGALPDTLAENELFGHEAGAYTDARKARRGLVEQAGGGTLFLDEIEALSPKGQVTLLRFLQDQEFRPLGGQVARQADTRVIAASNVPLEELAGAGGFRRDLLYRLNVLTVSLPSLSERPEDIEPLCRRTLDRLRSRYGGPPKRIHPAAMAWLERQPWPGNVRELENVLHRAYVMSESTTLAFGHQQEKPQPEPAANFQKAKARIVESFEREYLVWVMAQAKGNVTLAAKIAGKERRALGRLLKKHGMSQPR